MEPFNVNAFLAQEEIARHSVSIYAILTAFEANVPESAVDIVMEICARGDDEVIEFITVMAAGMAGLVEGTCDMTGQDPADFLQKAAHRSASVLADGAEFRRRGMI